MLLSLQLEGVALVPAKVTVPVVLPKLEPLMVTEAPGIPLVGLKPLMNGPPNMTPLLCSPPLVTTTLPVPAPLGTVAMIEVSDQLEVVAVTPLNVTVPVLDPKLLPEIVTEVPTAPRVGLKEVMTGESTVKLKPLP